MKYAIPVLALLAMCDHPLPARAQSNDFRGATLAEFMQSRSDLFYVGARDVERDRVFLFAGDPQTVTTWLPPYIPSPRFYNDPALGRAVNGLSAAIGTVPGVARTQQIQCQFYILAERIPKNGQTKSTADWRIVATEARGPC